METKEEGEGLDEEWEEEASMEPISSVEKKEIEPMSVLNIKEGQIEYLRVMHELHM